MNEFKDKLFDFIKDEAIFSISLVLAVISCFFNKPSLSYINWETILLLFAIMLVVEILKNLAVFEMLVRRLLVKVNDSRTLVCFLTFTCFFSSIFITNDVSLIVFVPFTILTLRRIGRTDLIIFTVSLETIAANVGCMVLPIGAPHNIVLYTASSIPFDSFFLILLPYIAVSLIMLLALTFFLEKSLFRHRLLPAIDFHCPFYINRQSGRHSIFQYLFQEPYHGKRSVLGSCCITIHI